MENQLTRYDRIAGCLFAGALGDALGYPVEFIKWKSIIKEYGDNGIQDLVPGMDGKAIITDDTQMTLFTCEGILLGMNRNLEQGTDEGVERCVYYSYLDWMQTQGYRSKSFWGSSSTLKRIKEMNFRRAPGLSCLDALDSGKMGTIEDPINNSKGCGGVMRTAPLGFISGWGDAMENGARVAAITHGHPGGWIPGGVLSDIIFRILFDESKSLKDIILASIKKAEQLWGDNPECVSFAKLMRRAAILAESDIADRKAIDALSSNVHKGGGWTGDEALSIAVLCCLRHPDDIISCLRAAVNHSGDSDSTGAIAGNILGAYLGLNAIPESWISRLEMTEVLYDFSRLMTEIEKGL